MMIAPNEEAADPLIDQLVLDQDPIIRYGGMFTMGLAYTCVVLLALLFTSNCAQSAST